MPDRRARARVTRRLAVFGPAAIVLLSGLLSLAALRRVLDTRVLVLHSRDVLDAASSLLTGLLDAETSDRGYLLTGDTTLISASGAATVRVDSALHRLRELTLDNPSQQRRLDTLEFRARERLALLDTAIRAYRSGQKSIAVALVARSPGRRVTDDMRRGIASVEAEEQRLLTVRESAERTAIRLALAVLALGTIIAGALAFGVNRGFDSALRERRLALDDARAAKDRLQEQAAELEHQADAAEQAAQAAEESERRTGRLQTATEAFSGALSLNEVATLIVDQAVEALGAHSGALAAMDQARTALEVVAVRKISTVNPGTLLSLDAKLPLCTAVRTMGEVVLSTEAEIHRRFPDVDPLAAPDRVQAIAAFPIENAGRALGGLLVRFTQPRTLSAHDMNFMHALSRIAGEALERARLYEAERAARAEAEAANRAKTAFLASMSHELRTPLQAALGFAQLVRAGIYGPVNPDQSEVLGRVERSQTHLALLIDDILDFARIEAGKVRIEHESVPLTTVFADLPPAVEPQALAKGVQLTIIAPDESLRVRGDSHRIQQILINLVGNAIKFTAAGGVIRVTTSRTDRCGLIQVSDTGTGIPADRLEAIFEPFVQVETGFTRTAPGTGLGLAISRDLARAMHGDLTAESEFGKGSTFTLSLPLAKP